MKKPPEGGFFLAVVPDLIRHPRWRANMDCGSSPQ
jgi:hypothetical protein